MTIRLARDTVLINLDWLLDSPYYSLHTFINCAKHPVSSLSCALINRPIHHVSLIHIQRVLRILWSSCLQACILGMWYWIQLGTLFELGSCGLVNSRDVLLSFNYRCMHILFSQFRLLGSQKCNFLSIFDVCFLALSLQIQVLQVQWTLSNNRWLRIIT